MHEPDEGVLAGLFGPMELLEIVQLIELNQKEGRMVIEGKDTSGELLFQRGLVISARSGELRGEAAAYNLLGLPSGKFSFFGIIATKKTVTATEPHNNERRLAITKSAKRS